MSTKILYERYELKAVYFYYKFPWLTFPSRDVFLIDVAIVRILHEAMSASLPLSPLLSNIVLDELDRELATLLGLLAEHRSPSGDYYLLRGTYKPHPVKE
jgi:hypothetical protein